MERLKIVPWGVRAFLDRVAGAMPDFSEIEIPPGAGVDGVRGMRLIDEITIVGFKSIARTKLELGDLNVVIGANGSGKSNLIGAFNLLERVVSTNLQLFVASDPDRLLYYGRKVTPRMALQLRLINNFYRLILRVAKDTLVIDEESVESIEPEEQWMVGETLSSGSKESRLEEAAKLHGDQVVTDIFKAMNKIILYHFHDVSESSPAKQTCDISDNRFFRRDAANLPAFLYWLQEKHPVEFRHIGEHVQLVAPFFDRFELAPSALNEKRIKLEWGQKGSDAYFDAYSLSDGTLRFICLATLLLQPYPPALLLLDEPELGLHPFAIRILAEMVQSAAVRTQIVLATQSVTLLNHFDAKDIIIAENDGGKTLFRRLADEDYEVWLQEYTLGELWEKNVLGGRP